MSEVAGLTWYHTIELPGGIATPGEYDTRRALRRIPFPASLHGKRCLDVGTHDGFWAFEMERRGAAEVVAIDLEDPRRVDYSEPVPVLSDLQVAEREGRPRAFWRAHEALSSKVDRRDLSVYELPGAEIGRFQFAFIGTLLLHLRDPVAALSAIRSVLAPGGTLLVSDAISVKLTLLHPRSPAFELSLLPGMPFWWVPNARGLRRYVEKAGFQSVAGGGPFLVPPGRGYSRGLPFLRRPMPHAWASGLAP